MMQGLGQLGRIPNGTSDGQLKDAKRMEWLAGVVVEKKLFGPVPCLAR